MMPTKLEKENRNPNSSIIKESIVSRNRDLSDVMDDSSALLKYSQDVTANSQLINTLK
jgi:hypothetical protein